MAKAKYKVTDADRKFNSEAWKRYKDGNLNYYYVPKAQFQNDSTTAVNT